MQKHRISTLLICCLLLGCSAFSNALETDQEKADQRHDATAHDGTDGDGSEMAHGHDKGNNGRGPDMNNPHDAYEVGPFQQPGVIVPGLRVSDVLELLANVYHAPSLKESVGEGCRTLGPVLRQFLGAEMVDMTCGAVLESLKKGTHLETSDMCIVMSNTAMHEQQEHPYSGGADNQGVDPEHDTGVHFNQYDQHQDMRADYPDGFVRNSTLPHGHDDYGDKHLSPDGAVVSIISMILKTVFARDFPKEVIIPIISETFEVDPNSVDSVCSMVNDGIFGESPFVSVPVKDRMRLFVGKILTVIGRLSPLLCATVEPGPATMAQYDPGQNGGMSDYPEHHSGPELLIGDAVRGFLHHLGGYANQEEFCAAIAPAAENYQSEPTDLLLLLLDMIQKFFGIVASQENCVESVGFLSSMFSSFGPGGFVQMLGFENEGALCTVVVDAFDPTSSSANANIDVTKFLPPSSPEEHLPPPFAEIMMIAGRMYNAPTLSDGLDTVCNIFEQTGQIYEILGQAGADLCVNGKDNFNELCKNHLQGFNQHLDEQRYEDHGIHEHDPGMMNFYDHNNPLHGIMKVLAMRYGLFDVMNPYSICEAGIEIIQTPMEDIISLAKDLASTTLANLFNTQYPMTVCATHNDATSGHSNEPVPDADFTDNEDHHDYGGNADYKSQQTGPGLDPSVEDLLEIVAFAANVESHAEFCKLITSHTGTGADHEKFLKKLATSMVNKVFTAIRDIKTCTPIANIVYSMSPEMVGHITGKRSGSDLCKLVISAFNPQTSNNFQPPRMPDVSTIMESQEEPFQSSGKIFSFLSVESVVKLAGKLFNQNSLQGSMRLMCSNYGKTLAQIPEIGGMISEICPTISTGQKSDLTRKCYNLAVPVMFGPHHPVALRTVNFPYELMKILLPMVNRPVSLEPDNMCLAQEEFINSDLDVPEVVEEILDGLVPILIDYGYGVCNDMKRIHEYLKPKNTSCYVDHRGQFVGWDGSPCGEFMEREMKRFEQQFNFVLSISSAATGFRNFQKDLCRVVTSVVRSKDRNQFDDLVSGIKDQLYSFLFEVKPCTNLLNQLQKFAETFAQPQEVRAQVFQFTGYRSTQALCVETVRLFNRRKKEVCRGITDCAGVCNGNAVKDCQGVCNGPAVLDCARQCNGDAYINTCGFCVGGRSRRPDDFGTDKCGVCMTRGKGYRRTTDCHGTCYGEAFYDKCGQCVGGDTGRSADENAARIDCRGICDGGWTADACGYCDPPSKSKDNVQIDPSTVSKHRDCHGTCHRPGTRRSSKARENECGLCVGGETGLPLTEGMNACDVCVNDTNASVNDTNAELSCLGCDGVAKSGKELDACGVCGGDGSDCAGVQRVIPNAIQENSITELRVIGAGFTRGVTLQCVFTAANGAQLEFPGRRKTDQEMSCRVELPQGVHEVAAKRSGTLSTDVTALITVFPDVVIHEMTPTDIDLGETTFEAFLTADEDDAFADLKDIGRPFIIAEGDAIKHLGERFLIPGKFASDVDNELQFNAPVPDHSLRVQVWGSLDGVNKLSMGTAGSQEGFPVTFWAEEPMFTKLQLDSNGASLTARFDLRVAYKSLSSCDDIFQDTTKLGRGAKCIWKGPTRLKIVIGKGNDLIVVGDQLTLKEGAVKSFQQEYSYAATGSQSVVGPRRSVSVRARLFGTERITSCGAVRLSARKSKGGAGRAMTYVWSVSSTADVTAIQTLLSAVTGPDFTMDGTLMDADTVYTFEVTVTNFLGSSDFDFIEVSRSATATPEVEIIPRGVDITNALVSEKFKLTAEVTFYSGCVPAGATVFEWSVDNDQVPLNLRTMNRRTLFVDANTLPGGQNVTFTIKIYKESDPDKFVNQSIQITTRYSDLQTVIIGGNELTIGRDAGNVTIDGSSSFDPDDVPIDMTYEWLCEQVTDETACWSYKVGEEGQSILSETARTKSMLQYDALAMEPEKMYKFTLVTHKGSRSSTASVNVLSMNGDPPNVKIRPIEGKIRSDKVFSLKARIKHTSKIAGYSWTTADTDMESEDDEGEAFAYMDLADTANLVSPGRLMSIDETHSVTFLSIKPGKLTPGSAYMFQLNISTVDGLYGLAKIDVHVLAEVTSCSFGLADGVNAYTELAQLEIVVEDCAADDTAYPLQYQMFMVNADGGLEAFTERQSEPILTGIGKPAKEGTNTNTFIAKVCDTYGSCASFSQDFSVTRKETFSVEEAQQLKETLVEEEKYKQNYIGALVNYNTISEKVDISGNIIQQPLRSGRAAASETSAQATEQLDLLELAVSSTVMDTATAQLSIDQLPAITVTDMTLVDQDRLLDVIIQLVDVFKDSDESISESGVESVLSATAAIAQDMDPQYNAALFAKIETIEEVLSVSMLSQLVVGGSAIETVGEFSTTSIQRAIPSGAFYSKSTGGVSIDFGSDIESRFGADWECSTGSCTGVAIHYDHFDTGSDFLSATDEDKNSRAADIISISLLDPESGEQLNVEDLTDPISMDMTLTIPKDNSYYECTFWNATLSQWSTDGLVTVEHSATNVECLSTHLTQFTVMAQANPTNAPSTEPPAGNSPAPNNIGMIIGSVVGGVVGVILLSFAIAFAAKTYSNRSIHARPGRTIAGDANDMELQARA